MTHTELTAWLDSRNAQMFSLPHPRMVVIQVQSLADPQNRIIVQHFDAENAIELAAMVFDLPLDVRRKLHGQEAGTC